MKTRTGSSAVRGGPGLGAGIAAVALVLCAALSGAVGLLAGALAAAPPAYAHAQVQDISPADGATLQVPPTSVVLTFDAPPLSKGAEVVAIGSHGTTTLSPVAEGNRIVAAWPPELGPGSYQVNWRAVSGDGHPVQGTTAFRIIGSAASSTPSASAPSQAPEPSVGASSAPAASAGVPTDSATTNSRSGGTGVPWLAIGAAALTLGLLVFGIGRVLRGRRSG